MTVNYDEQANHYEETRNVIPLVYSTLIAIIKPKANEKILDFGCGTGNYLLKLTTDYNIIPYGVEPSSVMRKIAAQKNPSATIVEGNHEAMPINIQFDSIYCTDVIHHIDNLRILFLNLFKISKPGTLLCICTESYSQLKEKYWNRYFPEILNIDYKRFHSINDIISEGTANKWDYIKTVSVEEECNAQISESFMSCVMEKTISVFRLLTEESYLSGLYQMQEYYKCGKIINQCEGYSFVVFRRGN